jgi:AraC-like DNA-binding protein
MTCQAGARIFATQSYRIRTLSVRDDQFVAVLSGRKGIYAGDKTCSALAGQGVAIARGTQWDVCNVPGGRAYEALVLNFSDELVRALPPVASQDQLCGVPDASVLTVDEQLLDAMQRTLPGKQGRSLSAQLLSHRVMEVLLLLAERGCRFTPVDALGWSGQICRLVAQRPDADWTVCALASHFHVSESTLRRRLDASETSLAALVREVRLETALSTLQTTALPVSEVARRCGWASHSRFSAAFRQRWGVAPTVVRARLNETAQQMT